MSCTALQWPNDEPIEHPDQPWNYFRTPGDERSPQERKDLWLQEAPPGHRRLEATDFFTITGRGIVFSMTEPDPPLTLGEEVEIILPLKGTVFGLERHPIAGGPKPGRPVGVQLRFTDEDG